MQGGFAYTHSEVFTRTARRQIEELRKIWYGQEIGGCGNGNPSFSYQPLRLYVPS
ncbi:hypothetical protein SAMN05216420_102153 [Nitrosospira sp. Nl5]|nr:hypothetical protein SAMN05216420_102153 [Nitrosospira sp. Nl5]